MTHSDAFRHWSTTADVQRLFGYRTPDATISLLRRNGLESVRLGSGLLWRTTEVQSLIASLTASGSRQGTVGTP